jgi:2-hydroxychromene-2-carboxylate isomerase
MVEDDASAPGALEFWFEFGSTYSHPAAQRIGALATARGVPVTWRPFLLGPIFAEQGWNDSPFNLYPAKGRYMWRDLERVCAAHAIPWRKPTHFPRNGLLAARVALAADGEAWQPDLVRALYRANFVEDREIGEREIVADVLQSLDQDAERWLARAVESETKQGLRNQTDRARSLGIFGAPSFTVAGELYWGHDRMEEALDHAARTASS